MNNFDYSQNDIVNALVEVGLTKGDKIFVYSNLGFFGILQNAKNQNDFWKFFKNAIFEVIGNEGTLVVPTFSYSFCWNKEFNLDTTPSTVGMFSELLRTDPTSIRSEDANFSIAAIGKHATYFTDTKQNHSFGKDSFWDKFVNLNGKICCFNVGLLYNTLIHYAEKLLQVSYRFDKSFEGISINNKIRKKCSFTHFVRDLSDPNTLPDLTKLNKIAYDLKKAKDVKLGKGQISCIFAQDILEIIKKEILLDPYFLIKDKPSKKSF